MEQRQTTVIVEEKHAELLDKVLENTKLPPKRPVVPEGWTLLEAGPVKKIRVNRKYIQDGWERPFIITIEGSDIEWQFSEVETLGAVRMAHGSKVSYRCCETITSRSAWVETTGDVLVKR